MLMVRAIASAAAAGGASSGVALADPACDEFVKLLHAQENAPLHWALVEEVRMRAVQRLFGIVLFRIKEQNPALRDPEPKPDGGQTDGDTPRVPAATPGRAPPATGAVKPRLNLPVASTPTPRPPTLAVAELAARSSWLDRLIVNGRPVGDMAPGEALSAKNLRRCEALFITYLLSGLPIGTPQRIRDFIDADQADQLWNKAQSEVTEAAA